MTLLPNVNPFDEALPEEPTTSASIPEPQESQEVTGPKIWDVIIIGGGPAGLTAAIYTARDGLSTLVLEGELESNTELPGGQLMLTPEIENFPGFASGSGDDLIEIMREQALNFGAEILTEKVTELFLDDWVRTAKTTLSSYDGRSVIIATGAVARRLGIPGEELHFGRGVSVCATCDGAFFRDMTVAVAGGGDTAVEDALFLTRFATKVYLVVRKDKLRTNSPEARALLDHPRVEVLWNTVINSIVGEEKLQCLELTTTEVDGSKETSLLDVDGLFVAIGHDPATKFLGNTMSADVLQLSDGGYLLTHGQGTTTSVPGVFAAGDVADDIYRQAITAAGSGCKAALDVERWLTKEAVEEPSHLPGIGR